MKRIAIVGGGPSGLFTAHLLQEYLDTPVAIDLFEASSRLGGKIVTATFPGTDVRYEAGAAEFYDYTVIGADPLRELVEQLGLTTREMSGPGVVLGDRIIARSADLAPQCGARAARAAQAFFDRCSEAMPPDEFYADDPDGDNAHPLNAMTMRAFLDDIGDDTARRYVEAAIHSDLATEPHLTTALYGIKNVLLDDPRYARYYCIDGGNERLVERLAASIEAAVHLDTRVGAVESRADGGYRLTLLRGARRTTEDVDIVVIALPCYWLGGIDWRGDGLRRASKRHESHFDRPAHYLRVTALFERPFWRRHIGGSWFMHDAFGGCCVYDETSRHPTEGGEAVLSWLIAGTDAMALSSLDDPTLIEPSPRFPRR
jgi:monoamine oxidase